MSEVEAKGLPELVRHLDQFGHDLGHMEDTWEQIGAQDQAEARTIVPVRSGALGETIDYRATGDSLELRAGEGLEYGGVIHYGWPGHNIEAVPFLVSAVLDRMGEAEDQITEAIADSARKHRLT